MLLQTVARVILTDSAETLAEQVERRAPIERKIRALRSPTRVDAAGDDASAADRPRERVFFNGLGGFTPDGREYVISLAPGQTTPAPWVNVLANARIGTVVTESGSAYTWVDNAHEFRLTPWHNDPVSDASGEAFYLRDEETGQFWSPTPLPARGHGTYVCRHGFGYSVFEYTQFGISSELWTYVALDAPVKLVGGQAAQRLGPAAAPVGHGLLGVGARPVAAREPDARGHRDRPDHGRAVRPQRVQPRVRRQDRLRQRQRRRADRHRQPHGVPRPQRHAGQSRRDAACAPVRPDRRGPRPLRGAAGAVRAGRRPGARAGLRAGRRATTPTRPTSWSGGSADRPARARRWRGLGVLESDAGRGLCRDARCRLEPAGERLAGVPGAGRAATGGAAATTSPAARTASATSSRTRRRCSTPRRGRPASICCAAPAASSARATCSTGGIRPAGAACARIAPTITCGCRTRPAGT